MNDLYLKELKKIMTNNKPPASTTVRSRSEIEVNIAEITKMLSGPLPNWERLNLVEARTALRKQLQ